MKLRRRQFLHLVAAAATLPAMSRVATAQTYPTRPVRIVVGYAAGGVTDIVARLMGQRLSERLGQQFIVENRTGANTNIATEAVVNAAPDGHTLLLGTSSNAINATLYQKLNFNFIRDIVPVAGIVDAPLVMEVHPSVPVNTVPAFIAYAKANPGKINMASAGIGSAPHVAGELFKMMANVNLIHVPYRGSAPALTEMIGGQVQVMFDPVTSTLEYIRSGKLRALAATSAVRLEILPDIPTVGDFLPAFEASSWQGLCAPKNTPSEIVQKLNDEINAALSDRKIKAQLDDLGLREISGSPSDYGKLIAEDTKKWAKVLSSPARGPTDQFQATPIRARQQPHSAITRGVVSGSNLPAAQRMRGISQPRALGKRSTFQSRPNS
jgi:tripartite-type tricarboxylate transporter receptor subunit TctC